MTPHAYSSTPTSKERKPKEEPINKQASILNKIFKRKPHTDNTIPSCATWANCTAWLYRKHNPKTIAEYTIYKTDIFVLTCKYRPTCNGQTPCNKCQHLTDTRIINLTEYDKTHPVEDTKTCDC
jgi:hypothetical protein